MECEGAGLLTICQGRISVRSLKHEGRYLKVRGRRGRIARGPAVRWDVDGSRAVNAVDVDGDGRLDLVFTHAGNRPSLWRTDVGFAPPAFQRVPPRQFIGRYNPYSIAWADLDDDTHLEMVEASYNPELMAHGFGTPSGGGVFLFTNKEGALKPDLLVSHAQALRNDGTGHFAPASEWGPGRHRERTRHELRGPGQRR